MKIVVGIVLVSNVDKGAIHLLDILRVVVVEEEALLEALV
jgi:hypothetical protein